MVKKLVDFALDQRVVTLALVALLIAGGLYAYRELPVEAFPDPDDPHVQVITLWPGQAAEDIETQVTRPIEQQLNSTPKLSSLRSTSMFGLSVVTMTFEDDTIDDVARSQVLERMQSVTLPTGATWQLGANTTSTGEIFRYVITRPAGSKLEDVRALQDWVIEPAIRQVSGVGDVNAFGGGVKQYQVFVKPDQLLLHGVTLQQVFTALQNNNANTGGNVLRTGEQSLVVRGVNALAGVKDADIARDIGLVAIANYNGHPVYVRDVAEVRTDMGPRQGIVAWYQAGEKDAAGRVVKPAREVDDIVEAIILNRKGTNALKVVQGVKQKVADLNDPGKHLLPAGVKLVPVYDRTELVHETLHTVLHNLIEGGVLILIISLVFTSNLRAALVIWLVIPLSLLSAFLFLHVKGVAANLLSFGAVDFGILVDAAVVIVEAVLVQKLLAPPQTDFRELVRHTSTGLGRPMLFSKLILITALLPIFTFQRVEGRIFRPMALTIAGAIVGATLVTLTLVPMASAWLLKWGKPAGDNLVTRHLKAGYGSLLRVALRYKALTIGVAVSLLAGSIFLSAHLGTEFLPKLDEGNIWLTVTMPLSISQAQAQKTEQSVRKILKGFPESSVIYSQLGRPDDGTDPKGWNNIEVAVYLPPREHWATRGPDGKVVNKQGLIKQMNERLQQIPGCDFNFSQVIEDNVEEALSGVKGELAIKLFGDDLKVLEEKGNDIFKVLKQVQGNADLDVEKLAGQPSLTLKGNREVMGRYGVDGNTVNALIETGLGGKTAGSIIEGQKRFDLSVRLADSARNTIDHISGLWVDTPGGQRLPLGKLTEVKLEEGASRISRDLNSRRIALKCGISDRDMGSFVEEAQRRVRAEVEPNLPPGYHITWEGQFENQQRANARLRVIVPASLLLVLGLLFFAFQRLRYALLILANVPFAVIGGIALLFITHTNLSVSASIGFIALAGVSVQMGMVLVGMFNQLRVKGMPLHEAVVEGSKARLRPVLMTALMAAIGMYPAAVSTGIGSEVQRPLALVILGGMLTAVLLTLLVLPALYELWEYYFPAPVTVPEGLVE
jgi:heavy metal efflux system protein